MKYLALLFCAGFIGCSHSEPIAVGGAETRHASSADLARVTCKNIEDVRIVEVKARDNGGCEVLYTKYGMEKSVASGAKGSTHCQKVREKIATQLTRSGFTCE